MFLHGIQAVDWYHKVQNAGNVLTTYKDSEKSVRTPENIERTRQRFRSTRWLGYKPYHSSYYNGCSQENVSESRDFAQRQNGLAHHNLQI